MVRDAAARNGASKRQLTFHAAIWPLPLPSLLGICFTSVIRYVLAEKRFVTPKDRAHNAESQHTFLGLLAQLRICGLSL